MPDRTGAWLQRSELNLECHLRIWTRTQGLSTIQEIGLRRGSLPSTLLAIEEQKVLQMLSRTRLQLLTMLAQPDTSQKPLRILQRSRTLQSGACQKQEEERTEEEPTTTKLTTLDLGSKSSLRARTDLHPQLILELQEDQ